ncbi:hypothetical protein QE400_001999 [Xanthomonas sacchari]|nr:hypothetical protein [Xanthomonas sacchari]MDQ1092586.1 hypothetical protein [Xanthomonas sacchari]
MRNLLDGMQKGRSRSVASATLPKRLSPGAGRGGAPDDVAEIYRDTEVTAHRAAPASAAEAALAGRALLRRGRRSARLRQPVLVRSEAS